MYVSVQRYDIFSLGKFLANIELMPAQTFPKQRVSRSETFLRFSVVFPHSEVRKVQELRKPTAVLARDGEGEKSALWLCLNLG